MNKNTNWYKSKIFNVKWNHVKVHYFSQILFLRGPLGFLFFKGGRRGGGGVGSVGPPRLQVVLPRLSSHRAWFCGSLGHVMTLLIKEEALPVDWILPVTFLLNVMWLLAFVYWKLQQRVLCQQRCCWRSRARLFWNEWMMFYILF